MFHDDLLMRCYGNTSLENAGKILEPDFSRNKMMQSWNCQKKVAASGLRRFVVHLITHESCLLNFVKEMFSSCIVFIHRKYLYNFSGQE